MSETHTNPPPSFVELLRTFGRIGLINFGGPAGQIALMHRVLVDEKRWIEEGAYLRALNLCTLLPGPEAQQLATYVGWKLHGVRGGLAAGLLFVVPGAVLILALAILYALSADLGPVAAAFLGVKAAVLAIVAEALLRVSRRALNAPVKQAVALAAFLALAVLGAPFPLVVVGAGLVGYVVATCRPELLALAPPSAPEPGPPKRLLGASLTTIATWVAVWAAPLIVVLVALGPDHVLFDIGAFFAKLAMVTFGGAYAVLAYMAQEAVAGYGWVSAEEMVDALGLAETTPGPLILVTEFVGFLAAYRDPAPFSPLTAGILGALMTLWMTFAPCFLWIFTSAPFVERLERAPRLQGALAAITAAVVGVIANLTLWFALHVLFARFSSVAVGPLRIETPAPASLDWTALVLSLIALILLFRLHLGVIRSIGVMVALALGVYALGL
jgi:chromate transporter